MSASGYAANEVGKIAAGVAHLYPLCRMLLRGGTPVQMCAVQIQRASRLQQFSVAEFLSCPSKGYVGFAGAETQGAERVQRVLVERVAGRGRSAPGIAHPGIVIFTSLRLQRSIARRCVAGVREDVGA